MEKKKHKSLHIISIILFIGTVVMNYLSNFGIIFPYNQEQISDKYHNLLAPAGFTFSIWGVIYLGVIITLIIPWLGRVSDEFKTFYYEEVVPSYILWIIFNIVWNVAWSYDYIIVALIAMVLYSLSLIRVVKIIDSRTDLAFQHPWLLLFPVGLHTGWVVFATYTNVMTMFVKYGLDAYSTLGVVLTIVLMVLAAASVLALFKKYDNSFLTVPALWALFGIMMKHLPSSDFEHSNTAVMVSAIVIMILSLIVHFTILKKHRETRVDVK